MSRRLNFILICVVISLSITLVVQNNQCKILSDIITRRIQEDAEKEVRHEPVKSTSEYSTLVETILEKTRLRIRKELSDYNFTQSGVNKLEDLVLESGGSPIRSFVVTSWRSGSTFFGELLNAMPSNFYHYEPLLKFSIRRIRGPPLAAESTSLLKSMLHCDYSGLQDYFEYGRKTLNYLNQFEHNKRLWDFCKERIELCLDPDFMRRFCKLFPFHSMKVVRYRLGLAENMLEDERLNLKVVLLVRDPRGVLQSRRNRNYCQPSPDCIEPAVVCRDMVDDYTAAAHLMNKFPGRVMTLRFEDLALNLNTATPVIQEFLKLGPTKEITEFLHTHTNTLKGGKDSTFRVTSNVPFKWKKVLDFEYVNKIQESCRQALELWGYQLAHNASHMTSDQFNPVQTYHVPGTERETYSLIL